MSSTKTSPTKLAKLMSIRALALSQGIPRSTMQDRIDRLQAEGPCPWILRSPKAKRGLAVRINVEMMRAHRPELFDPVCLDEQVSEHEEKIEAMAEVIRGHEQRIRELERLVRTERVNKAAAPCRPLSTQRTG